MEEFSRKQRIATCADDAYAWHTRPGVFRRLTPPWQQVELLESQGSFEERRRFPKLEGALRHVLGKPTNH